MKLSFETAKKVKDAGFPQEQKQGAWWYDDHKTLWIQPHLFQNHEIRTGALDVRVPTLPELLAWCGDGFISLDRIPNGWRAMGRKGKELVFPNLTYQSPEEAVAELGIKLHSDE